MRAWWRRLIYERRLVVMGTVAGIHLVVMALMFDPAPHSGGDNTAYLALARSLLDHGQYLELWHPGRPPHTQYPPGFPTILAIAWTLGLRSWAALKVMMVGFSTAAIGLSYLWLRHRVEPGVALGLAALLAVAPGLVTQGQWVLSDVPFWAVTVGALLALERGRTGWGIGLALLALTIRAAGLPLLLAIVGWLALERRWKPALGVLAAVAAMAALWVLRAPDVEAGYVSHLWLENPYAPEAGKVALIGLLERALANGEQYTFRLLVRSISGSTGLISAVAGSVVVAFAAVGLARRSRMALPSAEPLRRGTRGLVELFTVLYAGMILAWPEQWASGRFLLPILPVLLAYAAEGATVLRGPYHQVVRVGGALALLGLAVKPAIAARAMAVDCRAEVRALGSVGCRPAAHQAFLELAQWSRDRLPEDAVVISRKPRQWYWFSGYPGRVHPYSPEAERLLDAAREARARYVVLDQLGGTSRAYLMPAITEARHRFCLVQQIRQDRQSASLLGILETPWEPSDTGPADADQDEGVRVPMCPPSYRSDRATR